LAANDSSAGQGWKSTVGAVMLCQADAVEPEENVAKHVGA
jgi:hypothetical protein